MPEKEQQIELLRKAIMRANEELQTALVKGSYPIAGTLADELDELCGWITNIDIPF